MNIEIDTNEIAAKLSFLIGRTVLLKSEDGASCVSSVESLRVMNKPILMIDVYYSGLGIQHITTSKKFNEVMIVNERGGLEPLGKITDNLGIVF